MTGASQSPGRVGPSRGAQRAGRWPARRHPHSPRLPATFEAEQARFLGHDDPRLWSSAVTAWEAAGEPYPLAYAWLRRAESESAVHDREAAARAVQEADAVARADRGGADHRP